MTNTRIRDFLCPNDKITPHRHRFLLANVIVLIIVELLGIAFDFVELFVVINGLFGDLVFLLRQFVFLITDLQYLGETTTGVIITMRHRPLVSFDRFIKALSRITNQIAIEL